MKRYRIQNTYQGICRLGGLATQHFPHFPHPPHLLNNYHQQQYYHCAIHSSLRITVFFSWLCPIVIAPKQHRLCHNSIAARS